jgi:DNA-binding CsgD family transcriptional regulator
MAAAAERSGIALTVIPTRSWGVAAGLPIACAVRAKTAMGELDEASTLLRLPVPAEMFSTSAGLHYLYARGEYNLAARRYDAALHDFRSCEPLVTGWTSSPASAELWRVGAARAYLSLDTPAEAQRLIDQQLAWASSQPPRARAYSLRVLADMQGPTARAALLEKVLPLLRECGDLYGAWQAASDLSDACAPLGHHERSRLLAQEAQIMARSCLGLDPGRVQGKDDGVPSAGSHRLSGAEQRVAVLAAQGYSNREISQELFITVSTVEQHLTRIYRKLNVGRLQLHTVIASRPANRPDGDRR